MQLELVEWSLEESRLGSLLFYIEDGAWFVHAC